MERDRQIEENRLKLIAIFETILFLDCQGIAYRGHHEDTAFVLGNPENNQGNFLALLKFRVQFGDHGLEHHLTSTSSNAFYKSKTFQNELITICGDFIKIHILSDIQHAGFYSVVADEATDVANQEPLALSIRFISNSNLCEKLIAFHKCDTGVAGNALAENILSKLSDWQLQLRLLRGQAYDGAGSMAGTTKGVATRIREKHPKALYTHCAAHRLNLCVVKCCNIREVNNVMQAADSVSRFFNNSPKRQIALGSAIVENMPTEKRIKIKKLCRTRWVERNVFFKDIYRSLQVTYHMS